MIVKETKKILKQFNILAKKGYGQNFLINENILNTIVEKSEINKNIGVIEIGPGIGALTELLAINSKRVLCYEIDNEMIKVLNQTLGSYDNIIIKNIDFLKADVEKDVKEYFLDVDDVYVIANLPYYITTPIIFKLMQTDLKRFVFMVQKEVGERLTGKPNTKDYNALSVLMAYKTKTRIIANVSRKSFYPEPNVDSVVIHIETVKNDYGVNNKAKFEEFIQVIFRQRRKTLVNNISSYYTSYSKQQFIQVLIDMGYEHNIRAEALDVSQIVDLYKRLFE